MDSQHPDNRAGDDEELTIHHGVHHPHRVDVRIDAGGRGSMDPPLSDSRLSIRTIFWYFIMGTLTFAVAFGVAFYVQDKGDYRECMERNRRSEITGIALSDLATAAKASGDPLEAEALNKFRDRAFGEPLPTCSKPPFTREYKPGD